MEDMKDDNGDNIGEDNEDIIRQTPMHWSLRLGGEPLQGGRTLQRVNWSHTGDPDDVFAIHGNGDGDGVDDKMIITMKRCWTL